MDNQSELRKWGGPGRFVIDLDMIHNAPEAVIEILSDVIVVRAESLYMSGVIEYMGFSPHFKEVDDGTVTPGYRAIVHESYEDDLNDEVVKTFRAVWTEVDPL